MKFLCSDKCRVKCQDKFNEDVRQQIFDEFYKLGDKSIQSQQLYSPIPENETLRKRGKDKKNNWRSFTREYHLMNKCEKNISLSDNVSEHFFNRREKDLIIITK